MAGACKLPLEWNGCNDGTEFCSAGGGPYSRLSTTTDGKKIDFHLNHYFDEVVMLYDAKKIDASKVGVLNHLQYRRQYQSASETALALQGEYATSYFSPVYEALERRGLVMPVELPEKYEKPSASTGNWIKFNEIYSAVVNDITVANEILHKMKLAVKNDKNDIDDVHLDNLMDLSPPPRSLRDLMQNRTSRKTNNDSGHSILPAFSHDKSDLFLASMIEREADSWNLHITTFLLCHKVLQPKSVYSDRRRVLNDAGIVATWAQAILTFNNTKYVDGFRTTRPRYTCRITASPSHAAYNVSGENESGLTLECGLSELGYRGRSG